MSNGVLIHSHIQIYHSINQKFEILRDIDPATGEQKLRKIPGIINAGTVIEVPPEYAAEFFAMNRPGDIRVSEPDETDRLNWSRAGRLSLCD